MSIDDHAGQSWPIVEHLVLGDLRTGVVVASGAVLYWAIGHSSSINGLTTAALADDVATTESGWQQWCAACAYDGPDQAAIQRSALTYAPTGVMVADATTSLLEFSGGTRNWDYRFTWLRDDKMTRTALDWLGHPEENQAFFHWTLACCTVDQFVLHPIAASGDARGWKHPSRRGYAQSLPVRIGHGAHAQHQLDVYGEVLDAVWQYVQRPASARALVAEIGPLLRGLAKTARQHWMEPDERIWETGGDAQHFTYSKAQGDALDRAIRLAAFAGQEGSVDAWEQMRRAIGQAVLDEGYDAPQGAFTRTLGWTTLDASVLLFPQLGLIDPNDRRMGSMVEVILRDLAVAGDFAGLFLYRFRGLKDGVTGNESAFLISSTWLVAALSLQGSSAEARRLLNRLIALAARGLYAEEYDPQIGQFWGNYSQAFPRLGLNRAILHVNQAQGHPGLPPAGQCGWSADETEDGLTMPEAWRCS